MHAVSHDESFRVRQHALERVVSATFTLHPRFFWGNSPLRGVTPEIEAGRIQHAVHVQLLAPEIFSATLYLLDELTGSETERRFFLMRARDEFRLRFHPNSPQSTETRLRLRKGIYAASDRAGGESGTLSRPELWTSMLKALERGTDQPRAFGVEVVEFHEGRLQGFYDLNGPIETYYRIEAAAAEK